MHMLQDSWQHGIWQIGALVLVLSCVVLFCYWQLLCPASTRRTTNCNGTIMRCTTWRVLVNHDLQGNAQAARYSNDITPVYLALSFCRHSMAACDHSDRMLQIKGADANQRGLGVLRDEAAKRDG
jgi:hypothetical protein